VTTLVQPGCPGRSGCPGWFAGGIASVAGVAMGWDRQRSRGSPPGRDLLRISRFRSGANLTGGPGGVAQLVERYVRNVEAEGSSPFTSTRVPYSNWDTLKMSLKGGRYCSWQSRPSFTSRRSNTAVLNCLRVRSLALR